MTNMNQRFDGFIIFLMLLSTIVGTILYDLKTNYDIKRMQVETERARIQMYERVADKAIAALAR